MERPGAPVTRATPAAHQEIGAAPLPTPIDSRHPDGLVDRDDARSTSLPKIAALSYLAATLLGVAMRFELVGMRFGIDFDHLLHAHSHTLYFGWAGLGLLAVARTRFRRVTRTMRWSIAGLVALTPLLFFGFLATGYHPLTIAISTVVMLGWYVVAMGWWRQLSKIDPVVAVAFRYGLVYLVGSSLGIWALAGIQATEGPTLAEDLAIHAFLAGFGWFFVFAVVGAVLIHERRLGLTLERTEVTRVLHWWAALAWLTFPLGVVQGPEVWMLGPAARIAGVMLIVPGLWWVFLMWRSADPGPNRFAVRSAALWFGLATLTTGTAAALGSAALTAGGRQGVVIHLHALFAGFLTPLLAMALSRTVAGYALAAHHGTLGVMLSGLTLVAVGWVAIGMWVAAIGAATLWIAGIGWSLPILGRDRP